MATISHYQTFADLPVMGTEKVAGLSAQINRSHPSSHFHPIIINVEAFLQMLRRRSLFAALEHLISLFGIPCHGIIGSETLRNCANVWAI